LILFFLFLGYRTPGALQDRVSAQFSAVVASSGWCWSPVISTVYLFRTLHPQPIVLSR
jgi:hypothetical protein